MIKTATTDAIYKYLRESLKMTHQGACGMLGNMYAESACNPELAEELLIMRYDEDYKGKYSKYGYINGGYKRPVNDTENIKYNDALYIDRLKNGAIDFNEFVNPRAYDAKHQYGFGLTQVTSPSRKRQLWNMAKAQGVPIWVLNIQLEHLKWEMFNIFPTVLAFLVDDSKTLAECSDVVLYKFEQPNDADDLREERREYSQFYYAAYSEKEVNAMTDKDIIICGHGSGTPSLKNLNEYASKRYGQYADNGKHKGIVAVRRLKAMDDQGRQRFHDKYKTILGRNSYSQDYRDYCYVPYKGRYYSDCSSSGCLTYEAIGYNCPNLNTAGIFENSRFEDVPVKIENGHIMNPEVLKVGDPILFVGNDPKRPLQIGHVEFVYEIKGQNPGGGIMLDFKEVSLGSKGPSVWTASTLLKGRGFMKTLKNVCDKEMVDAINRYQEEIYKSSGQILGNKDGSGDGCFGEKCINDITAGLVIKN